MYNDKLALLLEKINIKLTPHNQGLYKQSMIHSGRSKTNQRLEFLGDSVLNFTITEYLYKTYPDLSEKELSLKKAFLVSRDVCFDIGDGLDFSDLITSVSPVNKNIVSCCMEALIGAVFLDSGIEVVKKIIIRLWSDKMEDEFVDYKTMLFEFCQKKYKTMPVYELISMIGQDHDPEFTIKASIPNTNISEIAKASNKKLAEKKASCIIMNKILQHGSS